MYAVAALSHYHRMDCSVLMFFPGDILPSAQTTFTFNFSKEQAEAQTKGMDVYY
jgi:hypothetical protein